MLWRQYGGGARSARWRVRNQLLGAGLIWRAQMFLLTLDRRAFTGGSGTMALRQKDWQSIMQLDCVCGVPVCCP
jgi:hypothetical protein